VIDGSNAPSSAAERPAIDLLPAASEGEDWAETEAVEPQMTRWRTAFRLRDLLRMCLKT